MLCPSLLFLFSISIPLLVGGVLFAFYYLYREVKLVIGEKKEQIRLVIGERQEQVSSVLLYS